MSESTLDRHARPLRGLRVLVTRPAHQAGPTLGLLERHGALPVAIPTIAIEPDYREPMVGEAIRALGAGRYHAAIFTSENGVRCFFAALSEAAVAPSVFEGVRIAAVGPRTSAALRERGLCVDVVAETFVAESLAEAVLALEPRPGRVLFPCALIARQALPEALRAAGIVVDVVPVYRTVVASKERATELVAELATIDAVMFTSSSTVTHLCALLGDDAAKLLFGKVLASIGPLTTATAERHGLVVAVTAEVSTTEGLVDALERFCAQRA